MIIATATDENYAEMAGVLLRSLHLRGEAEAAEVVLIGDELSDATVDALRVCAEGLRFSYVDLAEARRSIADLPISFYRTSIYIRLLLPDIVSAGDRLLYLDADTLVNGSLRPLFDLELGTKLLAAAEDCGGETVARVANPRLGHRPDEPYYNSGVLLFDLEEWRRLEIGRACIACAARREDYWPDQDAINIVLREQIHTLGPMWNFFSHDPLPRTAFDDARIIHFIPDKPLSPDCAHPMFGDYLAIRETTPWRDKPLTGSARARQLARLQQVALARVRQHREARRNPREP